MLKSVKKPVLLTLMVLLCGSQSHLEARHRNRDGSGIGSALCWVGGAIVGGLIGTAIYDACQCTSDSEELGSGQHLLNDARATQAKYAARYQQNCSCVLGENPSIDQLKHSILHSGSRRTPFKNYADTLSDAISNAQRIIGDLINKKNHLFECKMELQHKCDKMSREERISYTEQYENLITDITKQIETLQAMSNDLRRLESSIMGLPEYREEQLLSQINKLENKIDRMNCHHVYASVPVVPAFAPIELHPVQPCWYEPAPVVYEPAIVLHGNISVVEPQPAPRPTSSWGWGVEYSYSN